MSRLLRVAMVGVGWAGTRQAEAMRELGRKLTVDCLVDSDADFLRAKATELGVGKTHRSLDAALADAEVDAVSICTPHQLHCEMAIAAAQAGKHVLVEKPMATTVEEATRMIAAAEARGLTLYVAETQTYAPMTRCLRQLVQDGEALGELTFASLVRGFRAPEFGYPGRREWLTRPEMGGTGTWMLHGIHSMAQLRRILGEVETVYMREHHTRGFGRPDIEGTMSGLLTLESGTHVAVTQTCETDLKGGLEGYVLYGERGVVRANDGGYELFTSRGEGGEGGEGPAERRRYPEDALSAHALELEAFADQVAGSAEGPTTGRAERRSLAIVQAGYESASSGRPVVLRARFGEL